MAPNQPNLTKAPETTMPAAPGRSGTEAAAIANIVRRFYSPRTMKVAQGGRDAELLLVPEGFRAESVKPFLDAYRDAPERREGIAELADLPSFIAHVNRFKDADSAIFADKGDEDEPSLVAVLDYHRAGAAGVALPRFGRHRSRYAFPLSDEWKAWKEKDRQTFSQAEFAAFIENRLADVADPLSAGEGALDFAATLGCTFASATKLLELSRGLEVRVGSSVKNALRLESGEAQITFVEAHTDASGAPLRIPSAFIVAMPVFQGDALYQLPVHLRYRVQGGSVSWFYELYRADAVFNHAFREACNQARTETELPLFMGRPE